MANENEFTKILQNSVADGVLDNKSELEKRKEDLIAAIEAEESNVVKNPKMLENLKKELASVEKEIKKQEAEKAIENNDVIGKGAAEKDVDENVKKEEEQEKQEEVKDEKSLNQDEKEKEAAAKQAYHDAMMSLHAKRMQTINRQKSAKQLVSSKEDYEQELTLEAKMYEARDAYLDLGLEDPYTKKRTELIKEEKEAREPIELELRNRAKRYREIEEEIKEIDKREKEINEELLDKSINETQIEALNKELVELGAKRGKLEQELATIKDNLDQAIEIRRQRLVGRVGLEQKYVETLSSDDKKNYAYQQSKVATMNRNFDVATKQHYDNIKKRIEEREQKIKDINKELKEVPTTDFERRLVLLNELDKETNMLEADIEAKSDLDRGIVPSKEEMMKESKEKADDEEYRQKEFDKATDDARAVVEEQKEEIGASVVENPSLAEIEEQERDATLKAAAFAVVVDGPAPGPDTPLENIAQYVVAKSVIPGLEKQVKNIDDSEEGRKNADEYLEQDKQIKEANEELEKIEENIEKQSQR